MIPFLHRLAPLLIPLALFAKTDGLRPLDLRLEATSGAAPRAGRIEFEYYGDNQSHATGSIPFDENRPPVIRVPGHARLFVEVKDPQGEFAYAPGWESQVITPGTRTLAVKCEGTMSGKVAVTMRGKPLAGATFHRVVWQLVVGVSTEPFARTDAEGIAMLTDLPSGAAFLVTHPEGNAVLVRTLNSETEKAVPALPGTVELVPAVPAPTLVQNTKGENLPAGTTIIAGNKNLKVAADSTVPINPWFVGDISLMNADGTTSCKIPRHPPCWLNAAHENDRPIRFWNSDSRQPKTSRFAVTGTIPENMLPCIITVGYAGYHMDQSAGKVWEEKPSFPFGYASIIPEAVADKAHGGRFSVALPEACGYWVSMRPADRDIGVTTFALLTDADPTATLPEPPSPPGGKVTVTLTQKNAKDENKTAFRKIHFESAPVTHTTGRFGIRRAISGRWFSEARCLTTGHDGTLRNIRIPAVVNRLITSEDYNRQRGCCITSTGTEVRVEANEHTTVEIRTW